MSQKQAKPDVTFLISLFLEKLFILLLTIYILFTQTHKEKSCSAVVEHIVYIPNVQSMDQPKLSGGL